VRFVGPPTLGLIWINFIHLFMVALAPFATAWVARTRLASSPVALYGGLFVCVDVAYNAFEHAVLTRAGEQARIRAPAACGEASIARRPSDLNERDAGRVRGLASRLRAAPPSSFICGQTLEIDDDEIAFPPAARHAGRAVGTFADSTDPRANLGATDCPRDCP
jgi:hypothetical protein